MHSSILPLTSADDIATVLKSDNVEVLKLGLPRLQLTLSLSISPQTDPVEREKLERIVFAYISKNPELSDLFSIWDLANQNNITRVEVLVIDIIIAFLHLTDSALTRNTCNSIQREVLRNRNTTIHRNLSNGTHIIIASTLKLIIALNQRGAQTVRDVLVELNLTMKVFGKFAGMRLSKSNDRSGEDVRSVYINFVLSFLEYGDSLTKKQILEMKDIMGGILKGLARDSSETVSRVLQVLLNDIIRDSDLSRTVKVNFFNHWVLEQLATLYQTTGESKNSTSPAKLVHDFFLEICTSPNVGVCFRDNGWYSPHSENEDEISNGYSEKSIIQSDQQNSKDRSNKRFKVYNKILSLFVMSLNPTEDELQAELLLKILENCPELVASYLQNTTLNLDPRPNLRYLSSMTLLTRIISLPIPAFFHHTQTAAAPLPAPPQLTTILLNVSPIPSPIPRITFSKALQHDSPMIKYSSLLLLAAVIQKFDDVYDKLDDYAKFWERRSHGDRITYESGSRKAVQLWNDMKSRLLMEMKKRLPEFQVLVGLGTWCNSQITKFSTSGYHNPNPGTDGISATKAKNHIDSDMEVCGEETPETQPSLEEFELTTLEKTEMVYCCILKILKGYQKLLPDVVIESRFDMGKLVPSSLSKVSETTQSFVLEFLLECRDFKWLNKNDEPNTHLATVLTLHLTSARNSSIRELTSRVLTSWFTSFIGFQYVPNEPEIWVSTLPCSLDANSAHIQNINTVIHALIESVSKNPYNHIDTLSESLSNVEAENKISSPFDINTSAVEESEILEILRNSLHHTISYYKSRQLLPISPMFMEFLSSYALHCDTQIELEYFKILVRVVYLNQMVPEFMEYLVGRMADVEIRSTIYSCLSSDPYGPDVPSDSVQDVKRLLFSIYEQRHRCDSHLVNDVFRRIAEVQDFTTDTNIRAAICSIVLNHPVVAAIWSRFSDQFCQVCELLAKLIATCLASDSEIDTDIVAKSKLFKDQLIEKVLDDIRMNMELPNMASSY
ncbi:ribosome 60S biogenesis N-terminal-domain-containing protein [Paraphysoderma sedebokerense]|nr:ribosome 60S biogenesis N-terminal-domain-containing protein [Paraphysoderma sedebokerense]